MKQITQNRTYITIRIHKHNNENTQFTKSNRSVQNIQPYIQGIYARAVVYSLLSLLFEARPYVCVCVYTCVYVFVRVCVCVCVSDSWKER